MANLGSGAPNAPKTAESPVNEIKEVSENTTKTPEVNGESGSQKETVMDKTSRLVGIALSDIVRPASKAEVQKIIDDLFRTVCAINGKERYTRGMRVGDEYYSFSEYVMPNQFADFIVADAFLVKDDEFANDFKNRDGYAMTRGRILSPGEVFKASAQLGTLLRTKLASKTVVVPDVALLPDVYINSISNNRVAEKAQKQFCFTRPSLGDNTYSKLTEWVFVFAASFTA